MASPAHQAVLKHAAPLLKPGGLLAGSYRSAAIGGENATVSLPSDPGSGPNRTPILHKLSQLNFQAVEVADIGPAIESNPNTGANQEVYQTLFAGRKEAKAECLVGV